MINQSEKALLQILEKSNRQNSYENALIKAELDYQLKPYNIMKLTPNKVHEIYKVILKKFYTTAGNNQNQFWFENQLRIFVWIVIVYGHIQNKTIEDLSIIDWNVLSLIFNGKSQITLEFQTLCLLRRRKSKKWNQQEIKLLTNIVKEKSQKNRWNEIAKAIFIRSNKKYFRSPKQCRQQWINHLDPTKSRSQWTSIEDYQLIKGILRNGRKWSRIAKEIGNHRTEHMVKNRFKSLLNNQMKRMLDCQDQDILILKIKQRLQSTTSIKKYTNKKVQKSFRNLHQKERQQINIDIDNKELKQHVKSQIHEMHETEDSLIYKILRFPPASIEKNQNIKQQKIKKQQLMLQFQKQTKQYKLDKIQKKTRIQEQFDTIKSNNEKWMLRQQPEIDDLDIQDFLLENQNISQTKKIDYFFQ